MQRLYGFGPHQRHTHTCWGQGEAVYLINAVHFCSGHFLLSSSLSCVWCRANQPQQQDPGRYLQAFLKRMHIAHLKAAYGTAGMAALQLPKSIVHLMFMSRISNQVCKRCYTMICA